MTFSDEVRAWGEKVTRRAVDTVTETGVEVQRSVTEGSEITGAPGQPVDTGALVGSFIPNRVSEFVWETTTNLVYAPAVEEGIQEPYYRDGKLITPRAMQFQSPIGGAHSVALTVAGMQGIVDVSVERVTDGDP
jgi:hypothetical protein